ncbi:MAG: hypothetical protein GC185_05470 [Alphaproteobacteria bacterium]|nr:hypothetical protein [Alphaproteobacteria bacterium]
MSVASAFYKTTYGVSQGLKAAFNWASGNKALKNRGLERGDDGFGASFLGAIGGILTTVFTGVALTPVMGPLAIPVAVAAGTTVGFTPAVVQSAYIIGKNESEQSKKDNAASGQIQVRVNKR